MLPGGSPARYCTRRERQARHHNRGRVGKSYPAFGVSGPHQFFRLSGAAIVNHPVLGELDELEEGGWGLTLSLPAFQPCYERWLERRG